MLNANEILFRCSSLGHLMVEPRSKSEKLSEGCITHLIDVFVSSKYGRREEATGKMLDKGNEREEDSITLLSRITKTFYKKNDVRLINEFIQGEPDIYEGESIYNADKTTDTKTSWSAHTFFRAQNKPLDKGYYWQGQGYMWLTGAKKHTVAYCLVNGIARAIEDEKRRLAYSMGILDTSIENQNYKERCKQIEINHIFDILSFKEENPWFDFDNDIAEWKWDIPMTERLFTIEFERNEADILRLSQRIMDCREWMNENLFKYKQKDYVGLIETGKALRKKVGM